MFTFLEENWSFIDALYFCFISLTTIGLGDFVAGESPTQRNRIFYKICLTSRERTFWPLFRNKIFSFSFSLSFGWCDNNDVNRYNDFSNT